MPASAPVTVVILTHNRAAEVARTVERMSQLPERPRLIVVDNASTDGTLARLRARSPGVPLIGLPRNIGAAARNIGVAAASTRYVAFCDDDTVWAPGALATASALLDVHPAIGVLTARVLVGEAAREDPACRVMADSPLPSHGLPGRAVKGFLAGACVFRRDAYLAAGGYEPRLFIGGEEALLALDLLALGWRIVYCPALTVHHYPSARRDIRLRRTLLARNALWVAWLRRPLPEALRETARLLRDARRDGTLLASASAALWGAPWVLRRRRALPDPVSALLRLAAGRAPAVAVPGAGAARAAVRPTEP